MTTLDETADILSVPGALEEIRAGVAEIDRGEFVDAAAMTDVSDRRRGAELSER